jgi:hypothetical protein
MSKENDTWISKNMEKCHPSARAVIGFLMYTGLLVFAFYILIVGPIKDLVKNETTFTESLQKISGKSLKQYILIINSNSIRFGFGIPNMYMSPLFLKLSSI